MARPSSRARQRSTEAERQQRQAESRALQRRRRGLLSIGGGAALAAVLAVLVWLDPPAPGVEFPSLGNQHIPDISTPHVPYNSSPPSSGPHVGALARWGESDVPLPPELFVHNLEDAGVVLAYSCQDCPDITGGLRDLLAELEGRNLLMTPHPSIVDPDGVEHPAALVAWTRVLYIDEWTEETRDQARTFVSLYEGIDHHVRRSGLHGG